MFVDDAALDLDYGVDDSAPRTQGVNWHIVGISGLSYRLL